MRLYYIIPLIALIVSLNAHADSEDTQLRLAQQTGEQQARADNQTLANADRLSQAPSQTNSNHLGAVLYQALQRRDWQRARDILAQYEKTPNADALLVAYARGSLARVDGDYDAAISHLQAVIEQSPDNFLLPRLALGRAQFEDHQDPAAQQTFANTLSLLDRQAAHQQGVIQTVDSFLAALDRRQGWRGSLSIGITHNDNINQSSGRSDCLLQVGTQCLYERNAPDLIDAAGLAYEGVAERRFALSGNHGVFVRGIAFGDVYRHNTDFNQHQVIVNAGYSFQDVNDDWTIAPTFTYVHQGKHADHRAWGVDSAWRHTLSPDRWFRLGGSAEHQTYRQSLNHHDGNLYGLHAGLWQNINNDWLLFGQLRASRKHAQSGVDSYNEGNLRLGALKNFSNDVSLTLQAGLRHRKYDEFSALLGERRADTQQTYSATVRAPKWAVAGFEPSLKIEHTHNNSNVDWLYSYDNTEVGLQLEKRF